MSGELVSPSKVSSLMRRYGSATKPTAATNTSVLHVGSPGPARQHNYNRANPTTIGGLKRGITDTQTYAQTPAKISRRGSPQASAMKVGGLIDPN